MSAFDGVFFELFGGGFAGCVYGGEDASALVADFLVGFAFEPGFEFMGAASGVDEVGVAVDESGEEPRALGVDFLGGVDVGGDLFVGADPGDFAIGGDEGGVGDVTESVAGHGGEVGVSDEEGGGHLTQILTELATDRAKKC
jgi:hypothetical protein